MKDNNIVKYRAGDRISESALIKRMYAIADAAEAACKADAAVGAAQSALDAAAAAVGAANTALDQLIAAGITDGPAFDALKANVDMADMAVGAARADLDGAIADAESAHALALPPISDEVRNYLGKYMTALLDINGVTWGLRTHNQRDKACKAIADLFGVSFN